MELELKKECLDTYELGEPQTLTQEETAETIVPDYCPDIARIISAEGVVCLHGGTEQDGVTGTVRVTVLYTPENESGVRALEFAMPFSAQGEGLAGCAHVVVETEIELLESRMLNPRKIFTRCKLVTHLAGCRKVCLTISSDAETDPALLVEKRCCGQTVSLLRQVAEKDLTFSETMSLSLGREGATELLHCRANGIVTETKAIGNKLIFKGVFLVSALYRTIGGQLASASAELPFSQIMETDSTEENTQVSMRLRITGTDIQIDGSDDEGRQLSVTVYYHTMAFLRETREVTLLTDLYSTAYETRYEPSQLDLCSLYESGGGGGAVPVRRLRGGVRQPGGRNYSAADGGDGPGAVSGRGGRLFVGGALYRRLLPHGAAKGLYRVRPCLLWGGNSGNFGRPWHRGPIPGGFSGGGLGPVPQAVRGLRRAGREYAQGPVQRAIPDFALRGEAGIRVGGGEALQHHHRGHFSSKSVGTGI